MNTAVKIKPLDFSPTIRPDIFNILKNTQNIVTDEEIVETVNDFCEIVDRPEMKIIGVEVKVNFLNSFSAIQTVQRYIYNGTCRLLEEIAGNKHPGQYVAAVSEAETGVDFTYIIGVEVESFDNLPEFFPSGTVLYMAPRGRYGKVTRNIGSKKYPHDESLRSLCYLSREFCDDSGYCYDKAGVPIRMFDSAGQLTYAYDPVKKPESKEERYDSINYEIVLVPEIKIIGCFNTVGKKFSCVENFFAVEGKFDWKKAGAVNKSEYHSFDCADADGNENHIFGIQVRDFNNVPDFLSCAALPQGLYVKFSQIQINGDNPSDLFNCSKVIFFDKHPEFAEDTECKWFHFLQDQQGGCIYLPIRKVYDVKNC